MNVCMIIHLTTSLQQHHIYWTEENHPTNIIQASIVFQLSRIEIDFVGVAYTALSACM